MGKGMMKLKYQPPAKAGTWPKCRGCWAHLDTAAEPNTCLSWDLVLDKWACKPGYHPNRLPEAAVQPAPPAPAARPAVYDGPVRRRQEIPVYGEFGVVGYVDDDDRFTE